MKCSLPLTAALLIALIASPAMSDERVVTVSGQGEVLVEPDNAQVSLAIMSRADQQQVAQREVDQKVDAVLRLIESLDIPKKQVNTTRVNIMPEYRWDKESSERRIIGYMVQRSIEVNLTELEKLGELMQRATSAGVNQVSPPVLGASDEETRRREALARAAEDASKNAQVLARTLGAKLGPVRRITSSDVINQPPMPRMMMESRSAAMDAGGAETYTPGEIKFNASVTVEFDLEVD